jgi:hypothetical protein
MKQVPRNQSVILVATGQKEKLYNETNIYEMELAMHRAGREGED